MGKGIIVLVWTCLFSLQIAKAQYSPIMLMESSTFSQTRYTNGTSSPGATSYNFYFKVGKNGSLMPSRDGSNLRSYIKVCPDAMVYLDKYVKNRKINKRSKIGIIFSGISLLPGTILLLNGLLKPSPGLTVAGGVFLGFGIVGLPFSLIRNHKSCDRAVESLPKAVNLYNQYIIDNKLSGNLED